MYATSLWNVEQEAAGHGRPSVAVGTSAETRDRYATTVDMRDRSVLLVDDTWAAGAHAQAAAATLKRAGAVGMLAIGR